MKEIYPFPSSFSLVKSTCHFHAIYKNIYLEEHIDPFFLSPSIQTHAHAKQLFRKITATGTHAHLNIYMFLFVALTSVTRQEVQFLRIISQMHAQGLREQNILCLDSYIAATILRACSK